jgi:quercetin dioxygenase-like cupin family protein
MSQKTFVYGISQFDLFSTRAQIRLGFSLSARTVLFVALAAAALPVAAGADAVPANKLLTQQFEPRAVAQIEIGDFHFLPGQLAPKHTHLAPVFGYVSKGSIVYQVQGQEQVILKTGDVFYEPAGPEILHFDNASKTQEAVFTDFNFEREGEPFIVFPAPPTGKFDRRGFPTGRPEGFSANTMNIFEHTLAPEGILTPLTSDEIACVYVAKGSVSVKVRSEAPILYLAGQTFYQPKNAADTKVSNASKVEDAKLVRFRLSDTGAPPRKGLPSPR